jgi:ABC-type uncharacterized transport system YnjBCD ATPase subunit
MELTRDGSEPQEIVEARDLRRRFGAGEVAVDALAGVSVDFPGGRFAAIMGPSGSGKSTLLHVLAGLDRPTSGTVRIAGVELTELGDRELTQLRRDRIGFIFQTFNLLPVLNAEENILLPLSIAGRKPDREWFDRLVDTVGIRDRLSQAGQINNLLTLIYVLLALSVIVSLFGIVNTLILSIYERTRELGMMRAIGTSRPQVRQMIRYESLITALIGGVFGLVIGVVGAVLISTFVFSGSEYVQAYPVGTLVILLFVAALAGLLAAQLPARRAARLDMLSALASE